MNRLLAILLALLAASPALAARVAVLPFDKGTGSEQYDGLGKALAAMMVTDLSGTPGLVLVERQRLDDVLAELALSETAFVDPSTAQKLGKGLAAELLVVGTWSVVGETLVLSVRMVDVDTGEVKRSVSGDGRIDAFVEVEKQVVAGLLDGLAIAPAAQKPILEQVPSRSFPAVASYGEGLARRDEGRDEEARLAFAEAVRADPQFGLARTELGALRQSMEAQLSELARQKLASRAAIYEAALEALPPGDDPVAFALRLYLLDRMERPCARYQEMLGWADRHDWKIGFPKGYEAFWKAVVALGVKHGLSPSAKEDPQRHRDFEFQVQSGVARLFSSTGTWLYMYPGSPDLSVKGSEDLLVAMKHCVEPDVLALEFAEVRAAVRDHGRGDLSLGSYPALTLDETLQITAIYLRVAELGLSAETRLEWEALVAAHVGQADTHWWLLQQGTELARRADLQDLARVKRAGFSEAELSRLIDAIANDDPAVLVPDDPFCEGMVAASHRWALSLREARDTRPTWDAGGAGVGQIAAPLRDMGCLVGYERRFAHPAKAWAHVAQARARALPEMSGECAKAFNDIPQRTTRGTDQTEYTAIDVQLLLSWYYRELVFARCVPP